MGKLCSDIFPQYFKLNWHNGSCIIELRATHERMDEHNIVKLLKIERIWTLHVTSWHLAEIFTFGITYLLAYICFILGILWKIFHSIVRIRNFPWETKYHSHNFSWFPRFPNFRFYIKSLTNRNKKVEVTQHFKTMFALTSFLLKISQFIVVDSVDAHSEKFLILMPPNISNNSVHLKWRC